VNHEYFIAMAYGVSALAIVVEIAWLRLRRRQALRRVEEERDLEAQD
jgi:heme exporter protein CcmD